jgi:thymidylate kinase
VENSELFKDIPHFIYIFGPDGSGKTTQVEILYSYLKHHGVKVRLVWIKSQHSLAFIITRIFKKITPNNVSTTPDGFITQIHGISDNSVSGSFWPLIEFVSILPWILLRVYLPLLAGKIVIADRYVIDSVVMIAYMINEQKFMESHIARLMLRFIPKDSLLFHLDADYEEISKRRGSRVDPKHFIDFQRNMYAKFSRILSTITMDTSILSVMNTAEQIKRNINLQCFEKTN